MYGNQEELTGRGADDLEKKDRTILPIRADSKQAGSAGGKAAIAIKRTAIASMQLISLR
jgi:hypothetical protein